APHDAREHVSAEVVGPEPVRGARWDERVGHIHFDRVVRRDEGRERGDEEPAEHDDAADDHPRVAPQEVQHRPQSVVARAAEGERNGRAGHQAADPLYEMRGSIHAYSTSTSSVLSMNENADTSTTPCTTG